MNEEIDVLALGMATPLGLSSRATLAALRAGFAAHEEIDEVEDLSGESVTACRLEQPDPGSGRIERACFFASHALTELLSWQPWTSPPAVFLATPEPTQAQDFEAATLWTSLCRSFGHTSLASTTTMLPFGRAGLFHALAQARAQLCAGTIDLALVGGADSLVTTEDVQRLARANALLGKTNQDGLIPGEGAAFFLLARRGARAAVAAIEALALDREPEPRNTGAPPRAVGLTRAFAQVRVNQAARPDVVVTALPPQRWWGREFSHAYLRNAALMPEPLVTVAPSVALGDLGAAAGAVALGVGFWQLHPIVPRRGRTGLERALVYGCADEGTIGVCLLRSPRTNSEVS
ncbi:3-oxoacyl-(acyl carrier protein) synthase [Enhygromyxa salina]|uniref:3-oxoacyl-(Acyl carrier protein) synthase n=1 Tax=Enhygromyxa salina TaxID=215803 RepID=A0A2S9YE82_9BACT|nr:beta-ketoacyl synthase N-terminal-like domain-containing protein [Enhygromyxa salina]PRQ03420.1 3-oxoacyl-(acyl carrier protein) synthase [Enhygromyxa salina]